MIERFDDSCRERCQVLPLLRRDMTDREQELQAINGIEVFEGEISCKGICAELPGDQNRCNAAVTQPYEHRVSSALL